MKFDYGFHAFTIHTYHQPICDVPQWQLHRLQWFQECFSSVWPIDLWSAGRIRTRKCHQSLEVECRQCGCSIWKINNEIIWYRILIFLINDITYEKTLRYNTTRLLWCPQMRRQGFHSLPKSFQDRIWAELQLNWQRKCFSSKPEKQVRIIKLERNCINIYNINLLATKFLLHFDWHSSQSMLKEIRNWYLWRSSDFRYHFQVQVRNFQQGKNQWQTILFDHRFYL